jgi:parallel beta-helix repeat protein
MSLCINPNCVNPDNKDNQLFCESCGSELLLSGRYRVLRLLSDKGGFGNTYEIEQNNQPKVLKVLTNNHPKALELFQKEAEVLSELNHPGIPKGEGMFNYFPHNSQNPLYCLVMEKIEGMDLEEYQKQRQYRPIDQTLAVEWLLQLTDILHEVHSHNFFHRDIKPSNIILKNNGQLTLIDFGAVRQVTATIISGGQNTGIFTPGFAPPEQEKGYAVPQSDFYALGRTFVYLLTGKSPIHPDIYDRYNDSLNWHGQAPQIMPELADFIDTLMADKANKRPQNTTLILHKLKNIETQIKPSSKLPIAPLNPPPTIVSEKKSIQNNPDEAPPKIKRRKALKMIGLTGGGLLLTLGLGKYLTNNVKSNVTGAKIDFNQGKTLTVSLDGNGDYTSINEAINNAEAYSTIIIKPGTYQESILINKPLQIMGEGEKEQVIIENNDLHCLGMNTDYALVRKMTFNRKAGEPEKDDYGVNIPQGNLILEDCEITSESLACIGIHGVDTAPEIRRCLIHSSVNGSGVYFYENAKGLMENCEIYENTLSGIAISDGSDPVIKDCKVYKCKANGIYVYEKAKGKIENCQVYSNELSGISIHKEGDPYITQCTIYDGGLFVYENGIGTIENCNIVGTKVGAGIEIREKGNPYIANCKIYDGNSSGVYIHNYGIGTMEKCEIYNNAFHGFAIVNYGDIYLNECKIYSNVQVGILCYQNGTGIVEKTDINQNLYSGVEIRENGNLTLTDCKINNNKDHGVYLHDQGKAVVTNCDLTGNGLEGLSVDQTSTAQESGNKL